VEMAYGRRPYKRRRVSSVSKKSRAGMVRSARRTFKRAKRVPRISGYGAYYRRTSRVSQRSAVPSIINKGKESCVTITHKEYICDIEPSVVFKIQKELQINPGLPELFPWGSAIAQNFQEYKLNGMAFFFKSMSNAVVSSEGTSGAIGSVIFNTQYNVLEDKPSSKREMLNSAYAKSCKPNESMLHPIECSSRQTPVTNLYVRSPGVTTSESGDRRLYDFADVQIATEGCLGDQGRIGELWVTYEWTLYKPKMINQDYAMNLDCDLFVLRQYQKGSYTGEAYPAYTQQNGNDLSFQGPNYGNMGGKVVRGGATIKGTPNGGVDHWYYVFDPALVRGAFKIDQNIWVTLSGSVAEDKCIRMLSSNGIIEQGITSADNDILGNMEYNYPWGHQPDLPDNYPAWWVPYNQGGSESYVSRISGTQTIQMIPEGSEKFDEKTYVGYGGKKYYHFVRVNCLTAYYYNLQEGEKVWTRWGITSIGGKGSENSSTPRLGLHADTNVPGL